MYTVRLNNADWSHRKRTENAIKEKRATSLPWIEIANAFSFLWNTLDVKTKHLLILYPIARTNETSRMLSRIWRLPNGSNKKYKILVSTIIYWSSSRFVKKWNQKFVYISFSKHVNVMWLGHVIGCLVLLSYSHWLRKRCNLQPKNSAICE